MLLSDVFTIQRIKPLLESETKDEAFEELVETIVTAQGGRSFATEGSCAELNRREILQAVSKRESKMTTAILPGIAVPHGYCRAYNGITGAIGISRTGIAYDADDNTPVHCIIMIVLGETAREKHLRVLNRLLRLLTSQVLSSIQSANNAQEIHDILHRFG
jgi:mannitol/fructose-specific phosphotransferase system IIA component (Ntr-type)